MESCLYWGSILLSSLKDRFKYIYFTQMCTSIYSNLFILDDPTIKSFAYEGQHLHAFIWLSKFDGRHFRCVCVFLM